MGRFLDGDVYKTGMGKMTCCRGHNSAWAYLEYDRLKVNLVTHLNNASMEKTYIKS